MGVAWFVHSASVMHAESFKDHRMTFLTSTPGARRLAALTSLVLVFVATACGGDAGPPDTAAGGAAAGGAPTNGTGGVAQTSGGAAGGGGLPQCSATLPSGMLPSGACTPGDGYHCVGYVYSFVEVSCFCPPSEAESVWRCDL